MLLGVAATSANAAITAVGSTRLALGGVATTLSLTVPAGTSANDVMVVVVAVRGGSTTTLTPPAGWTLIQRIDHGTTLAQTFFYRVAGPSEPGTASWTIAPASRVGGVFVTYRGVDPAQPINAFGGQANQVSTDITAPSITTLVNDTWLVMGASYAVAGQDSLTPPGGMTERFETWTGGTTAGLTIDAADMPQAMAGATGPFVALGGAAAENIGQLLALTPARLPQGSVCTQGPDCSTGFCVDGRCCDLACGGSDPFDCMACSTLAGAPLDGQCGVVLAGRTCRPAVSVCDVAESCDGVNITCGSDLLAANGTPCVAGQCVAGVCTGNDTDGGAADGGGPGGMDAGGLDGGGPGAGEPDAGDDGGAADAGEVDGGPPAGTAADGGSDGGRVMRSLGVGCGAVDGPSGWAGLLAGAWAMWRASRRPRSHRALRSDRTR